MKNIHSENLVRAPRYPHSSLEIIRRLLAAIKLAENPSGTLHEVRVAKLIGIPKSTFNDWGHRYQTEQIRRFLSGVERLPEAGRTNLLRSLCRHCPRLEDPRISHDKQAVSLVKSLILRGPGVSLIKGPNWARHYLLGAIGNSFAAYLPIAGFDAFPPVDLVPVPGVSYPARKVAAESLSSLFEEAWPDIEGAKDSLILLNRIWERIVTRHRDVLKLAAKNHLVVAGDFPSVPATIRGAGSVNVIHVESIRGDSTAKLRIRIGIR